MAASCLSDTRCTNLYAAGLMKRGRRVLIGLAELDYVDAAVLLSINEIGSY